MHFGTNLVPIVGHSHTRSLGTMNAEERPFPIVHPRPSMRDAFRTMSGADMLKFAAVAGLSFPLGFLFGA